MAEVTITQQRPLERYIEAKMAPVYPCLHSTIISLFYRSARVNTTGPWVEILPSIHLKDVSIQIDRKYQGDGSVAVWAINRKGDVLCRTGVTADCPQVSTLPLQSCPLSTPHPRLTRVC
jgi:hypothetical protein